MRRAVQFKRLPLPLAVEMDVAPLIDIVFQQLIFFMLTSAFVFQPGVKIQLPRSVTADVARRENLVVTISNKGHLYLGTEVVTLGDLKGRLASMGKSGPPILIRADREASLGRVVEVWDLCRSLGISQLNIATSGKED